jgi:hypothetical protein
MFVNGGTTGVFLLVRRNGKRTTPGKTDVRTFCCLSDMGKRIVLCCHLWLQEDVAAVSWALNVTIFFVTRGYDWRMIPDSVKDWKTHFDEQN